MMPGRSLIATRVIRSVVITLLVMSGLCASNGSLPAEGGTDAATEQKPAVAAPSTSAPKTAFDAELEAAAELFGNGGNAGDPAGGNSLDSQTEKATSSDGDDKLPELPSGAIPNDDAAPEEQVSLAETGSDPSSSEVTDDEKIDLLQNFDAAVQRAQLAGRPLLVVFGATWCSWCRKLESDLASRDAEPILRQWVVVKLDVDNEPELAERFQATTLPALRVVNSVQSVVASQEGYLELPELQTWLTEQRTKADPKLHRVLFATGKLSAEDVKQLIELMGDSAPAVRTAAVERLASHRSQAVTMVAQVMGKQRLMQQLSARELLLRWDAPVADLDPWRPETWTDERVGSLIKWAQENESEATSDSESSAHDQPAGSEEAARDGLRRLLAASVDERPSIVQQLVSMRMRVQPLVAGMLATDVTLSDDRREALRELKYHLVSGAALRLQDTGLLSALARLDANAHRQAAIAIGEKTTADDQTLLDELVGDADPTIREAAIRALGRLGLLTEADRLARYLKDENTNVRIAILQALTESPDEATKKIVCDYLAGEQNEDLLVRGIKYLATLGETEETLAVFARLAQHSGWQVRAAVLDAIVPMMSDEFFLVGDDVSEGTQEAQANRKELAQAVLACAQDADPFVVSRALVAVPHILNSENAAEIASLLTDHPQLMDDALIEAFQDSPNLSHLTEVASGWIAQSDIEKVRRGVRLLTVFSAETLRDHLPTILKSEDLATRINALRAFMQLVDQHRRAELEERGETHWREKPVTADQALPWYSPDQLFVGHGSVTSVEMIESLSTAGAKLSTPVGAGTPNASTLVEENSSRSVDADLDAVDDFFGTTPATRPQARDATAEEASRAEEGAAEESAEDSLFAIIQGLAEKQIPASQHALTVDLGLWTGDRPSEWMTAWNRGEPSTRPEWMGSCLDAIEEARASNHVSESLHGQMAWAMMGHAEEMADLLQHVERANADNSQLVQRQHYEIFLNWLPAEVWLDAVRQKRVASDEDMAGRIKSLKSRLVLDDRATAQWILNELAAVYAKSLEERSECGEWLAQALLGARYERIRYSSADVQFAKSRPYRVSRVASARGLSGEACNWLRERFFESTSDRQKAITLAALVRLDFEFAIDASLGTLQDSHLRHRDSANKLEIYPETVEMAMAILSSTPARTTANLLVMLLEHANATVRTQALTSLAEFLAESGSRRSLWIMYDESVSLPTYFYAQEPITAERLKELASASGEGPPAWALEWLRLATTPETPTQPFRDLFQSHDGREKIALGAALAKCQRTDTEALECYRAMCDPSVIDWGVFHGDNGQARQVYVILQEVDHPEVMKLRQKLREQYGAGVLQN